MMLPEETLTQEFEGEEILAPVQAERQAPGSDFAALKMVLTAVTVFFSVIVTAALLVILFMGSGNSGAAVQAAPAQLNIMDRFDTYVTNEISNALEGVVVIKKEYWLSDSDLVAPEPNPANFGQADSPAQLQEFLAEASDLLDGQETIFNVDTPAWDQDKIYYYLDDTIMVITWKEIIDRCVFTFSEVRIAHPSQFRRFLAGGEFGSDKQYVTTEMAESVNAVVASSGDFYKFRKNGIMVYEGQVQRMEGKWIDTCMIDDQGDLHFIFRKQIMEKEEAQKYVDENNIRFSLAFGPVLVDGGVSVVPHNYSLGEIDGLYSRAALCQVDDLHYLLVAMNGEKGYKNRQDMQEFGQTLASMGVQKAYALDGGQTAVIAMQGKTINRVEYGYQRQISDIIYFATALPEGD